MKKKKIEFSKIIVVLLFIILFYVLYKGLNFDFNKFAVYDIAFYVTAVTVIGGILGSSLVQYYKKSSAENIKKIQTSLYRDTTKIRLRYNEEMMKLKLKYEMSDDDVSEFESRTQIDEISDNVLDEGISELNNRAAEAHEDISEGVVRY